MTPGELDEAVREAAAAALAALDADPAAVAPPAGVRRPRHQEQGDYATPLALRLARETGLNVPELARGIAAQLTRHPGIHRAEAAGPGFVSIWLTPQASAALAGTILTGSEAYGHSTRLTGQSFILDPPGITARHHASPDTAVQHQAPLGTRHQGPVDAAVDRITSAGLSLGQARRAALAAATGRLLRAAGAGVTAEPGPGVTRLHIPGPAATRTSALATPASGDPMVSTPGQLVAAVGVEAASYALVSYPPGIPVVLDVGDWARRTRRNPSWAVRHARQRIAALAGRAEVAAGFEPALLAAAGESALLSLLAEFPAVVAVAGRAGEPHRVARYLESVAAAWEACEEACPVIPRRGQIAPDLARARLTLAQATGVVLANGLRLLGVPS